jgi:hypothetical protein
MRTCLLLLLAALSLWSQPRPRARDLGVPLEGTPGPLNAIVDVAGVEVGHRTLISGTSVRTGVTAVWPLPHDKLREVLQKYNRLAK